MYNISILYLLLRIFSHIDKWYTRKSLGTWHDTCVALLEDDKNGIFINFANVSDVETWLITHSAQSARFRGCQADVISFAAMFSFYS